MVMIAFFKSNIHPPGYLLGGYRIIKFIGEGRFGICYLVELNGSRYVLKQIKAKAVKKYKNKVLFEEQILSTVNHSLIPRIVDTIKNNNTFAYILEYKKGKTIEEMIFRDMYKFNRNEIYTIGIQLIDIMKYLHKRYIVHRDIRIPNVILNKRNVYLIDFGLARFVDNEKYIFSDDFLYFGHFLLHLYYSSFVKISKRSKPWYKELKLSCKEMNLLKRLLGINIVYESIYELESDFLGLKLGWI
jgi:serine/threonine-protein kinase